MALTYILYSQMLDRYYVGHTAGEPEERLRRHLSRHDGYTAKAKDWVIVWQRRFETKEEAYGMERTIKSWKSQRRIRELIRGE